jgi:hypothetical protein
MAECTGFGVWLACEHMSFLKEKGLEEEFYRWQDDRHKESMLFENFLKEQHLDSVWDKMKGETGRPLMRDRREKFLEERGLTQAWQQFREHNNGQHEPSAKVGLAAETTKG